VGTVNSVELVKMVVSALALILSGVSLFLTLRQGAKQKEKEGTLESRRFIVPLWDKLVGVRRIDPHKPIVSQLLAVHTAK
jgi:hypothetical protein